jgi:hypothetical protein
MALTKGDDFPIHQAPRQAMTGPHGPSGFAGVLDFAK